MNGRNILALTTYILIYLSWFMVVAMVEDMVVAVGMEELGAMEVDMVVALLHEADN